MSDSENHSPWTNDRIQSLVHQIAPDGMLLHAWHLEGGISACMTALEIEFPDGSTRKMVVRQPGEKTLLENPQAAEHEYRLLQAVHSLGLPAPAPLYMDNTCKIFPDPYLVTEYIEGKAEFAPSDPSSLASQMAIHLARLHSATLSSTDLSFLPPVAHPFGQRPTRINESLDEGRIRKTLESAWPWPQPNPSVLLHGDFWPGNVLWQAERLAAIIDWEDARMGDPLIDLAISRLDILWIYGLEAMNFFTNQYRNETSFNFTNLPLWDLAAALRLVRMAGADLAAWAAFFLPFGRRDITEQSIRIQYKWFVNQAFRELSV